VNLFKFNSVSVVSGHCVGLHSSLYYSTTCFFLLVIHYECYSISGHIYYVIVIMKSNISLQGTEPSTLLDLFQLILTTTL
jgi:hypothetical protein